MIAWGMSHLLRTMVMGNIAIDHKDRWGLCVVSLFYLSIVYPTMDDRIYRFEKTLMLESDYSTNVISTSIFEQNVVIQLGHFICRCGTSLFCNNVTYMGCDLQVTSRILSCIWNLYCVYCVAAMNDKYRNVLISYIQLRLKSWIML
jgi:hypothetical protein